MSNALDVRSMTWTDVIWLLNSVKCAVETREVFSHRMNRFRNVSETDIETLDRLLKELTDFRLGRTTTNENSSY
jgi:hypothetical protein